MREHGVVDRVMILYEVAAEAIARGQSIAPEVIDDGAAVVRSFIQDYHEKLEEDHLFPIFGRSGELTELVATLRAQHRAGYRLTDTIQALAKGRGVESRRRLVAEVRVFVRMYRAHAAHEDTVLFPALHRLISPGEYDALGESFEAEEHRQFGTHGFEKVVRRVTHLEQALGVDDLDWFTPA